MLQFAESFEPDALTCIFNNNKLFSCLEQNKYSPFNDSVCANIYDQVCKFRTLHHKMPDEGELSMAIKDYLDMTKDGVFKYPDYSIVINKMFVNELNSNFTLQTVIRKLQDSLIVRLTDNYSTLNRDTEDGMTLAQLRAGIGAIENMDVLSLSDVEEVSYTMDLDKRMDMYHKDDNIELVPTPWAELNQHIRGGPGLGDECIVIGPTGRGKSTILAAITAGAIKEGIGVLYFNLETSKVDTCEMLDAHFIGKSRNDIRKDYNESFHALLTSNVKAMVVDKADGNQCQKELLRILAYPPNTITLNNIEDIIKQESEKIHNLRMLVIDWGDCIKPLRQYSERRHEYSDVFHGLKALARKYKLVVWTATMGNKDSLNKKVVTLSDISESYGKAFMARLIITICQTPEEKNMTPTGAFPFPVFRFWVAKNSKGPGELEIPMKINYGTVDISYNSEWDDKMRQVYGFLRKPKEAAPVDNKTIADGYNDEGAQLTKGFLTGDSLKSNWKAKKSMFKCWNSAKEDAN